MQRSIDFVVKKCVCFKGDDCIMQDWRCTQIVDVLTNGKMCINILTVFIAVHTIKTNIKAFFYELNKFLDFDLAYDLNQSTRSQYE